MPMAVASPEKPSGGEVGDGEEQEKEMAYAEVRQLSDQALKDKELRVQSAISSGTADRLPDRGRKLRVSLEAVRWELARRLRPLADRAAPPHPSRGGGARARAPNGDRCERIGRSWCAESSGLASDSHTNKVTRAVFLSSFGMDVKAGTSGLEITSLDEPNTSAEEVGKLCEENESCKPSSQPMNLSYEELDNLANIEKISSDNGDNRMCKPSPTPTPSHKRKGGTQETFTMRLRSRKGEAVLLDGDTPHPESAEEASNNRDAKMLYYPSREHPDSVEISFDDVRCLQLESLLSSPIMNFYIMYLQGPASPIIRPKGEYHIFNTYFFSKLEALTSKDKTTYFLKLRRWWKGVDIFQKAYILLPVHAETHWSLVIVCMPSKEDQTGPIILHLDSLKFHSSRLVFSVISRFLKEEWNYLNQNVSSDEFPLRATVWKNLPHKIEKKTIEVPQQENDYDCGPFVLYYMQRFVQEAPERLHKKDLSMFGKAWFQPEEPSHLRLEIRRLLRSCGEDKPKNDATTPSCGEAESKNDATVPSCGEDESKNDATVPPCGEAESKNDAMEPSCVEAESRIDVAATKMSASVEENCRSD